MHLIQASSITISQTRQRKELNAEKLMELSNSIATVGLIHPIVVRGDSNGITLVAGERRFKAIQTLWASGQSFTYGGSEIPEGQLPCNFLKDLDPLDAMEVELEENIRRQDLTWQESCEATSQLVELRRLQASKRGDPPPAPHDLATQIYPEHTKQAAQSAVHEELMLASQLSDPDVAKAPSRNEAIKVIRRKEEAARQVALGESVGKTFGAHSHRLVQANCLEWMAAQEPSQFDVILTDPPYGIDAQDFNDSGGKANAAGHTYDDSYDNWARLVNSLMVHAYCLSKPQAHLYCFCDIDRFTELRDTAASAGWKPFRTPFVWYNPTSQRAPWPQHGPHRRYQICLYAIKGDRPVLKLASDLVEYRSDENLGWAAQKPVALFADLLSRSCRAGDSVLDPFCGSGTVFPAAHGLKIKATGVEMDPVAYGIAVKRIGELK